MNYEPYLSHLAARGWSPETVKAYKSDLSLFAAYLEQRGLRLTQVTSTTITEFIEHLSHRDNPRFHSTGLARTTIARRLAAVSCYFDYLRATSAPRLKNPVNILNRVRLTKRQHSRAINDDAVAKLTAGIDKPRDKAVVILALSSGLRLSELAQLNRSSITVEEETDDVGNVRRLGTGQVIGKGSKERCFYIDSGTIDAIADYLLTRTDALSPLFISERKQRLSPRAIQHLISYWCRKLELPHLHPHRFRHTYAERLANASIDSMVLKELMGHESFNTTTQYFRLSDRTKAREYFSAMELARKKS